LQHLEKEADEKDAELEAANREIEKLSDQVYMLEEENDRIKEESDRIREDDAVEQERLEALSVALKEVRLFNRSPFVRLNSALHRKSPRSRLSYKTSKTSMIKPAKTFSSTDHDKKNSRATSRISS
jgi:predicted  nucleic acid-binding Zn-ribbon protein